MTRARQVANFDPALFAADEVSGDKVSGGTIGAGVIGASVTGGAGLSGMTSLGTVATGTWEATDIGVAHGGTGASTHTANSVLVGAGASAITSIAPGADGQVLTSTGSVWQSEAPASSGVTHASQWQLTVTQVPGNSIETLSNWAESSSSDGIASFGSSMTESSGEFTFPTTGNWLVSARPYYRLSSSDNPARMTNFYMKYTSDDWSSEDTPMYITQGMEVISSDTTFATAFSNVIVDITNVSTHHVRFYFAPSDPNYTGRLIGATGNDNKTFVSFIRLS